MISAQITCQFYKQGRIDASKSLAPSLLTNESYMKGYATQLVSIDYHSGLRTNLATWPEFAKQLYNTSLNRMIDH